MFCPKCHYEYQPSIVTCPDCGADLVAELPPIPPESKHPEDSAHLVTIFESFSLPEVAIAKSILEEAGIHFFSRDQIADAAYFVNGPSAIKVNRDDAGRARELLANLAMDHMMDEQMDRLTFDDETETGEGENEK
jgi:hypothetical protein